MKSSSFTVDTVPQADGRVWVHETHIDDGGNVHTFDYLSDGTVDANAVLAARAARIDSEVAARALVASQANPVSRRITPDAFMSRLTGAEQAKIELASTDVPGDPTASRLQAASLRAIVRRLSMVAYVDLDRRDAASAWALLHALEAMGLLDAVGRADAIISADPKPTELPSA